MDFLKWTSDGALVVIDMNRNELIRIRELMLKYKELPMDLADGSLIAVCEKLESRNIATIGSDFEIYRYQNRYKLTNVFMKG